MAISSPMAVSTITSIGRVSVLFLDGRPPFLLGWLLTGILALVGEQLGDLLTDFTLGDFDVVLGVTGVIHQGEETVVADVQLYRFSCQ